MARIRTIKPEFFANEQVGAVPFQWRLLFIGLWLHADREGRLQERPQRLKAMLFPYDDLNIEDGLGCLANARLIDRYEGNGLRLISIPTWAKHQQPHVRELASVLPPPPSGDQQSGAGLVLAPPEGKGTDQEGKGTRDHALRARFERFWDSYPRKVAKEPAWTTWRKLAPDDIVTAIMIAKVREHSASPQWRKDAGQFIPHPRTWLNQKRWQDDCDGGGEPLGRTPAPAHWRDECRELGHEPSCEHASHHSLRKDVAAKGCAHHGVCRSLGEHAQKVADERKVAAS